MAVKSLYTCDYCGKPVSKTHEALLVSIKGAAEIDLELCDFNCLRKWLGVPKNMKKGGKSAEGDKPETDMSKPGKR